MLVTLSTLVICFFFPPAAAVGLIIIAAGVLALGAGSSPWPRRHFPLQVPWLLRTSPVFLSPCLERAFSPEDCAADGWGEKRQRGQKKETNQNGGCNGIDAAGGMFTVTEGWWTERKREGERERERWAEGGEDAFYLQERFQGSHVNGHDRRRYLAYCYLHLLCSEKRLKIPQLTSKLLTDPWISIYVLEKLHTVIKQ